ncbi:AAA family ATPase [Bradyrhizobium diazoefficiens]|uniref:UvrD-helicase domain-containing protein n=1 Tax=Bradyrhizobium diazoefficiens TaxID=1355477 RepID=UPI001B8C3724|nr:AAA family ATPase [Bradyrhizobium diazoefficiens]MBR0890746.1 AAA family ATPase [Bradyrhizobium diazoefficiens]MBR0922579.1 AAA family ATPase [Bradyrhizobium diazoefficiens]
MVAKAAYAIHPGFVTPERIILLAFNKQAAEELKERASKSFERLGMKGVSVEASTFHALATPIDTMRPAPRRRRSRSLSTAHLARLPAASRPQARSEPPSTAVRCRPTAASLPTPGP